jgi:Tfp pilus assembly protein PilX
MRISGNRIEHAIRNQAAESARVSGKGRGQQAGGGSWENAIPFE